MTGGAEDPTTVALRKHEHPLRESIANEVHARPFESLTAPLCASHLAMFSGEHAASREQAHVAELCRRYGVQPPVFGDTKHVSIDLGTIRLRWERHSEFSTYTFFVNHAPDGERVFECPAIREVPADWLEGLPGLTLAAAHLVLEPRSVPERGLAELHNLFGTNNLVGAEVTGGAALMYTDFRVQSDGFTRVLVQDRRLRERQAGRLVQRILDIESYRNMALLALPAAQEVAPRLSHTEERLTQMVSGLSGMKALQDEQALLRQLSELAGETEQIGAATNYRFAAARAYYGILNSRIEELRESRIEGLQLIREFMERRMAPALNFCEAVSRRQRSLSNRIARAADLLRTRVDVALEDQNRRLLESMNHRARLQLRLQQTVEGLSVVVISYYLIGLLHYALEGIRSWGMPLDTKFWTGVAVLPVVLAVWLTINRARHLIFRDEGAAEH